MSLGIAVVSGGLDSTTMLYDLLSRGHEVEVVSFNYGQRHVKELEQAKLITSTLNLEHYIIDVPSYGLAIMHSESSLVDIMVGVPEGSYDAENMKSTVVPNRNMVMLAMAAGVAVASKAQYIATAVHAGDHAIYPDCRADFITSVEYAIKAGNQGFIDPMFEVRTPYIYWTKTDIARRAGELDVPIENTWSCLTGDTEVVTLNQNKPIAALRKGDWVWGWTDEDGWTPALVEDFFVQGVKPVYEVVLDDLTGRLSRFKATGNHLLMLRDGSYARVDELERGISLMPASVSTLTVGRTKKQYHAVRPDNNWTTQLQYMHRIAARFFGMDIEGKVVHHLNDTDPFNTFNNYPNNLASIGRGEHSKLTDLKKLAGTEESNRRKRNEMFKYHGTEGLSRYLKARDLADEGRSITEIAKILDYSLPGAKNAIRRGRELENHKIVSITPAGEEATFDIQTSTRNFAIGAGIFVHNCYKGSDIHCGRCGTCVERLEALHESGVEDKTVYQDTEFWKTAVAKA